MKQAIVLAASLATATAYAQSAPPPRTMSLDEALRVAADHAPEVEIAGLGVTAAERRETAAKRQRFPTLRADANIYVWNKELAFDVAPPGTPGAEPVVVRDQVTTAANLTMRVPLSTQFALRHYIGAQRGARTAAQEQARSTRLDVQHDAATTYLQLLAAQSALDIAQVVVTQRQAQVERAEVLANGGVLEQVDVMRLRASLADARRQEISARTQVASAGDALAVVIGSPEGALRAIDSLPDQPGSPQAVLQRLGSDDARAHPQVAALLAQGRAAEALARVERAPLYPDISAIGTFQTNTGQGEFAPKTAFFVGVTLEWNFWDWGKQWNLAKAADADAKRTQLQAKRLADQLSLETRRRMREAEAAFESLDVAAIGRDAAEEAFRIQSVRFNEGAATTTDLLDAETDVTRARLGLVQARYDYFLSLTQLARAAGLGPKELLP